MSDTRPRLAILSYSTGEYDARSFRVARSAVDAGYHVTLYARWTSQPAARRGAGRVPLIRVDNSWQHAVPWLRKGARARWAASMAEASAIAARASRAGISRDPDAVDDTGDDDAWTVESTPQRRGWRANPLLLPARLVWRRVRPRGRVRRWVSLMLLFPLRPLGWASALESAAEPADVWHGMWAGSLPALARMRQRHGGRTIYDSRDVYMLSRDFFRLAWPFRPILVRLERRWAQGADLVLTVNEHYADLLTRQLGVPRPPVVMNTPDRWTPPVPAPDLIRDALGLSPETGVVLYQGQLNTERGIEQAADAILRLPGAVLVLLGFGPREALYRTLAVTPPYVGRVLPLPPVPPSALLAWTASSDVMVMPIQPTTTNHEFTTPQKLWEAIAAGVPVVASDLPGMAEVVRATGAGVVCDPTSPAAIADAVRSILEASPEDRAAFRERALTAAHDRYNWETQAETLLAIYRGLLDDIAGTRAGRPGAAGGA